MEEEANSSNIPLGVGDDAAEVRDNPVGISGRAERPLAALDIRSAMTQDRVDQVAEAFKFPENLMFSAPVANQRPCTALADGEVCFPLHAFIYGLRLPIPVPIRRIFQIMKLALAQIDPNG